MEGITCIKCGEKEKLNKKYYPNGTIPETVAKNGIVISPEQTVSEHLDWQCMGCGFTWQTDTFDKMYAYNIDGHDIESLRLNQ